MMHGLWTRGRKTLTRDAANVMQNPMIGTRPGHPNVHPCRHRKPGAAWFLMVSAATVALGSCGGGTSGSATTVAAASATSGPSVSGPAGGCGTATTPGSTTLTTRVAGRLRTVIVHIPKGYAGSSKVPLVLNLHGSGTTAADQEAFSGMDATSDSEGFVVAYPQGLIPSGAGFDWNVPGVPLVGDKAVAAGAADDVTFLTTLVRVLEQRYCLDAKRVGRDRLLGWSSHDQPARLQRLGYLCGGGPG